MSIKAMTWAFDLPLEPRAKIALLAIADNARDDGVCWPKRETIARKTSQSRATINRRLRLLCDLGVIEIRERFREDGSQTTDEIRIDMSLTAEEVKRRMAAMHGGDVGDSDVDASDDAAADTAAEQAGDGPEGGCQADTPPVQSGHPGAAVVTRGGLQSCNPHEQSLEQDSPPSPPPGGASAGDGPLRKIDREAIERREQLWQLMLGSYPGISAMDQREGRSEFEQLAIDDAEWAVGVAPLYAAECGKLRKPPKNIHLWLRKAMFRNFSKAAIRPPDPERVWIAEHSEEDRALRVARTMARAPSPFVMTRDGARGYLHRGEVGDDLKAMLAFAGDIPSSWIEVEAGSEHFAAWQARMRRWIGAAIPVRPGDRGIRVPTHWPPKKDGTIYRDEEPAHE